MRFIIFIKENKLRLGAGEPVDHKETAFRITSESGREEKIAHKSILFEGDFKSSKNITQDLAQMRASAQAIAQNVETEVIWELSCGQNRTVLEIGEEWFGKSQLQPEEILAVAIALTEDTLRFKAAEGKVTALDAKVVKDNIAQKERDEKFELKVERAVNYLLALFDGKEADHPDSETILSWVEQAVKREIPQDKVAQAVFERIKNRLKPYRSALITILKRAGKKPDIPSITLARFNVAREFSRDAINQTKEVSEKHCDYSSRRDLTGLFALSIDSAHTRDYDDALSVEVDDDSIKFWMHITDCGIIEPDSPLDKEAYERIATLYLPDRRIPMLPATLSEDCLSLKAKVERDALTHYFKFDKSGEIIDFELFPSVITVDRNLSYETANSLMSDVEAIHELPLQQTEIPLGVKLNELYNMRNMLLDKRIQRGARPFWRREIRIRVDQNKEVELVEIDRNDRAMQIIEEFSILTNALVAKFCRENKIPALYRFSSPSGIILSFEPTFHSGLGLDAYVQATSPIRRYTDMLMQRQISSWFKTKKPLYLEDVNFLMRAKDAERRFVELKLATEQIEHYWKLVYLQQNINSMFTVVMPRSRIAYVYELVLPVSQPLPPWMAPRTAAKVKIKDVDPDIMKVEFDILEKCSLPWEVEEEAGADEANS